MFLHIKEQDFISISLHMQKKKVCALAELALLLRDRERDLNHSMVLVLEWFNKAGNREKGS